MKLSQVVVGVFVMAAVGIAFGGASAAVVVPSPISTLGPGAMTLGYTVGPVSPGGPALLSPSLAFVQHPGMVQIYLSNVDGLPHAYMLTGAGGILTAPPHGTTVSMMMLSHPGQYNWVSVIPSPGVPSGMTVGVVIVR
jgi:hypothetical protein